MVCPRPPETNHRRAVFARRPHHRPRRGPCLPKRKSPRGHGHRLGPRRSLRHQLRLDRHVLPMARRPDWRKSVSPASTSVGSNTAVAVPHSVITRRVWIVETGLIADQPSARKSRPASSWPAARDSSRYGVANESGGEAWQRAARQCAVGTDHPRRVAGTCELTGQRLSCISSGSAVLGLARCFRPDLAPATLELFLLIISWKILRRSQSTNQILTAK